MERFGSRYIPITIPTEHKSKILQQLEKLNISEKTLFPDIDHTAGYIKKKNGF